ncbi:hypothetical protein HYS03_01475 [Candidatus Woesebacteria bacterium]|nr:hypothetical protein [Candidatus Woesebacteria bacterium]QQG47937.1 MAG: hypothetical protein HY044_02520 [Candidatus Woesebacteria bacterium]
MRNKITIFILLFSLVFPLNSVKADEIVITANGDSSNNQITVNSTSETNVTQTNANTSVSNNVNTQANTGSNSASQNQGNTQISTGDIVSKTDVQNSLNTSEIKPTDCCKTGETKVEITNNSANSQNTVDQKTINTTTVSVTQSVNITTNITGIANTGNNVSNQNEGSVKITTGDIKVSENLQNGPVASTQISLSSNQTKTEIKIASNSNNSQNKIINSNTNNTKIIDTKNANILNNSIWILNTGGNTGNKNNGDVKITTGDIDALFNIKNYQINSSAVKEGCLCSQSYPPPVDPGTGGVSDPSDPGSTANSSSQNSSSNSSSASSSSGSGPQILGLAYTNDIIPSQVVCDEPKSYYQRFS